MRRIFLSAGLAATALLLGACAVAVAPPLIEAPPALLLLPVADGLGSADRQAAYEAQIEALDSGERRSWRGPTAFGFVEPGPVAATGGGYCRPVAETIFVDGRPRRGQGEACRQSDGGWRLKG